MHSQHPDIARRWEKETPAGKLPESGWKDTIKGGKADKRKPSDFDPKELEMGADDEHEEHTSSWHKAKEIAMDHLVGDPHYYTHQKQREDAKDESVFDRIMGRKKEPVSKDEKQRFTTKTGLALDLEVNAKQSDAMEFVAYDPKDNDEPVSWIDVDVWPQRKLAKISLAMVKSTYRKKGIGQAVYPIINRETKKRFGLPLASDDNDKRSEHAEKLWKRLESLGLAHKDEDRYRMEAYVPSLREWFGGR